MKITVDLEPLVNIINALNGPPHLIREIMATRILPNNDFNVIEKQVIDFVNAHNKEVKK